MSFDSSRTRPLARSGWGAQDFRGCVASAWSVTGTTEIEPQLLGIDHWGQVGTLVYRSQGAWANQALTSVALRSDGTPAPGARVDLHLTAGDAKVASAIADASGIFSFYNPGTGPFYFVMYLQGSPDFAGTTVNTLMPT